MSATVPQSRRAQRRGRVHAWAGAAGFVAAAVLALGVFALPDAGWGHAGLVVILAICLVLGGMFLAAIAWGLSRRKAQTAAIDRYLHVSDQERRGL